MTIDKIKNQLPGPIFDHITSLNWDQLEKKKLELVKDMELIKQPEYFAGNCNDLYYMRDLEMKLINHLLS
jgi:hypothetical protein